MVTEDLEKSLRDEVSRHTSERLNGLRTEVERLQTQVNEAFAVLAERTASDSIGNQEVAAAISEHLHTAHTLGIEAAAAASSRTRAASDVAIIKAAIDDIDNQRTQTDILNALVNRAASFAPRVAFFIIKNDRATGWRARGLEGTVGDAAVRELSLPLETRTLLSEVVETRQTWSGASDAHADDASIFNALGSTDAPARIIAVPLVARGRAVAALYADSAGLDADAINLEALETLVRVAGMAVELLATQRAAPIDTRTLPAPQPFVPPAPAVAAPPPRHPSTQPINSDASASLASSPPNLTTPAPAANDSAPPAALTGTASPTSAQTAPLAAPPVSPAPSQAAPKAASPAPSQTASSSTAAPEASGAPQPPANEAPASHSAPLGAARRFGGGAADLPVEVADDEEKRLHNDARRFARLLVSEIKLYNEQKVREGRTAGNLYDRLREEIDRSREMYDKRVAPPVSARHDYFHHELVNTLAEGEPEKLGESYPGTTVNA